MAYSTNPNLPRARGIALKLLIVEQLPLGIVARRCGVHRSTIWRWKQKWQQLNQHIQDQNVNRPSRPKRLQPFHYRWNIPTGSSRPHTSPRAIPDCVIRQVLAVREQLKRCAEAVWHYLRSKLDVSISLSSVRRILRRHHCFDGARKPRVKRDNPHRPLPTRPGELVQIDTVHHIDPYSGRRLYYYTVIDLYSRATYVALATKLSPGLASSAILRAQERWRIYGFASISMAQADNGPEFGRYFEQRLRQNGIQTRHTRLGRPNDNAHIERFNRTLQEECIGHYWHRSVPLQRQRENLSRYVDFYNTERIHLGIQMRTPAEMLQRF